MMIRLSSMPTGSSASGRISQERLRQADVVHGRLECDVAHHRVLHTVGLDLQFVVAMTHRLRDERENPRIATHGSNGSLAALRTWRANWYSA